LIEEFYSSALKRKTLGLKTARFLTFPDYLMVHMLKFTAKNGQTVKLDVAIDFPEIIDLETLRGKFRPNFTVTNTRKNNRGLQGVNFTLHLARPRGLA